MASRTVYTSTALQVLTSANFEKMPKGWIGYVESTTTVATGVAGTNADLSGITVTVDIPASRLIEVRVLIPRVASNVADVCVELMVYEGATKKGGMRADLGAQAAGANGGAGIEAAVVLNAPSAASHTYKAVGVRTVGTGLTDWYGAADIPAWIRVSDLGPSY